MTKITKIICDRCEKELTESAYEVVTITRTIEFGGSYGKPYMYELCRECSEPIKSLTYVSGHTPETPWPKKIADLQKKITDRETDMQYIREKVADALVSWGEGNDNAAREALRRAAARAAQNS